MWPFRKRAKEAQADDRWAAREKRLTDMWPDINDPASPRYYAARMTGRELQVSIEVDRILSARRFLG